MMELMLNTFQKEKWRNQKIEVIHYKMLYRSTGKAKKVPACLLEIDYTRKQSTSYIWGLNCQKVMHQLWK